MQKYDVFVTYNANDALVNETSLIWSARDKLHLDTERD